MLKRQVEIFTVSWLSRRALGNTIAKLQLPQSGKECFLKKMEVKVMEVYLMNAWQVTQVILEVFVFVVPENIQAYPLHRFKVTGNYKVEVQLEGPLSP